MYYCNSRYYDPNVGRFINADGILGANDGIQGYNMFAYCNNDPINYSDPSGYCGEKDKLNQQLIGKNNIPTVPTGVAPTIGALVELGKGVSKLTKAVKRTIALNVIREYLKRKFRRKIYDAAGDATLRALRRPAFDEMLENGIKVGNKEFELNQHAIIVCLNQVEKI